MKRHIKKFRIPVHSPEWHKFRENGIGASELSSVMATVSPIIAELTYTPPIKYFLEKIFEPTHLFTGNIASNSGIYFEPIVLQWYKAMDLDDPDQMKMFENLRNNVRINRAWQPKEYVVNEKYPWLFSSPDAYAKKNGVGKTRLIENKWSTSMTSAKFENGIDPSFFLQIQQNLITTELEVADLNLVLDGRWYTVVTIEADKEIHEKIIDTTHDFWKKVIQARIIKLEYDLPVYYGVNFEFLTDRQKEGAMLLSELEPSLIGTDDELKFVQEMVKPREEDVEMQGSEELKQVCIDYKNIGEEKKLLDKQANLKKAEMILALGGFNKAVFDDESFFTYKADSNKVMRLYISPKVMKSNDL